MHPSATNLRLIESKTRRRVTFNDSCNKQQKGNGRGRSSRSKVLLTESRRPQFHAGLAQAVWRQTKSSEHLGTYGVLIYLVTRLVTQRKKYFFHMINVLVFFTIFSFLGHSDFIWLVIKFETALCIHDIVLYINSTSKRYIQKTVHGGVSLTLVLL